MTQTLASKLARRAIGFGGVLLCFSVAATELIYTPVNPTFGGNPLNASGLLANANAQNDYKAPVIARIEKSDLELFNEQLQTAILARLRTNTLNDLFKTEYKDIAGKAVKVGNIELEYKQDGEVLVLVTRDASTGASQTIRLGTAATLDLLRQ